MFDPRRRRPGTRPDPRGERGPEKRPEPREERGPGTRPEPRGEHGPVQDRTPRQEVDPQQSQEQQRIITLLNELTGAKMQLNEAENLVNSVDDSIIKLPARVTGLRQMNYLLQPNLEVDQQKAVSSWAMLGATLRSDIMNRAASLRPELDFIERELNAYRSTTSLRAGGLNNLTSRLSVQKSQINDISTRVRSQLAQITSVLRPIEKEIASAEETVKRTSTASFKWKQGETPVISIPAKNMKENVEGILTLTNQRLIYEVEKEVVLKKILFLATEKKTERQVYIDKPIGTVSKISKGKVGLFEGEGLYIDFKQDTPQLVVDAYGDDADETIKLFNQISSGQIDLDLSKTKPADKEPAEKRLITCPYCGAPYRDEIYRGQISVQCKYCSTVINTQ